MYFLYYSITFNTEHKLKIIKMKIIPMKTTVKSDPRRYIITLFTTRCGGLI